MATTPTEETMTSLSREGSVLMFNGVPVDAMLAYPARVARVLLGVSRWTFKRAVDRGDLKLSPLRLVSKQELERFLAGEKRRPGRPRKITI